MYKNTLQKATPYISTILQPPVYIRSEKNQNVYPIPSVFFKEVENLINTTI